MRNPILAKAFDRRQFLGVTGLAALGLAAPALAGAAARVVIIGAGFGGATCARVLRRIAPDLQVTLIERDPTYVTCPFSNLVIAGFAEMSSITYSYDGLKTAGIEVVIDTVTQIDSSGKAVTLQSGSRVAYDRLIVCVGIDFKWDAIPGYDEAAAQILPHAWKAGAQTKLLRTQLQAMEDGGTVLIAVPESPYRCPPGPYERASLIAAYLQANKPKSKLVIVDAKDTFAKQKLFNEGWSALYPDVLRWVGFTDSGGITQVDPATKTVVTAFETFKADVINIIPPQMAGALARASGLAGDGDWCTVDPVTFESVHVPLVHVLGDATSAGDMPKSGTAASSQARICAYAVAALMSGAKQPQPTLINTCYSFVAPDYAISVSEVFRPDASGTIKQIVQELSPSGGSAELHNQEGVYAKSWYQSITQTMFG